MIEGFIMAVLGILVGIGFGWYGGRSTERDRWISMANDDGNHPLVVDDGAYVVMTAQHFYDEWHNPRAVALFKERHGRRA